MSASLPLEAYGGPGLPCRTGSVQPPGETGDPPSTPEVTAAAIRGLDGRVLSECAFPTGTGLEPHWKKDYVYVLGRHVAAVENTEPGDPALVASEERGPWCPGVLGVRQLSR